MELAAKLETALVAYLQSLATFPAYFSAADQIRPGEDDEDKDAQYLRCRTADNCDAELPTFSGNFWWPCEVELRTPSADQTDEANSQLEQHQEVAAVIEDAMLASDLVDQLNAAALALGTGYELTVMAIREIAPARNQDDEVYSSGWTLKIYCCSSTLAP